MNYHGRNKHGRSLYKFKCDCGREVIALGSRVKTGVRKSCGCLKIEKATERLQKHGKVYTKEYRAWSNIRKAKKGRICERWVRFENFIEDVGKAPTERHMLCIIDKEGIYEKGNVHWRIGNYTDKFSKAKAKVSTRTSHKGIVYREDKNKYECRFVDNGKSYYAGQYDSLGEAILCRKSIIDNYNKMYDRSVKY